MITTVAGNGSYGFSGDNGQATSASLVSPSGIAFAPDGSLLIADRDNNRIRRVDSSGIITTVAGTGGVGYNGDGIPAAQATLNSPSEIATDATGNLYIVDTWNCAIRKVDAATRLITTVAGSERCGFAGDGGMATLAQINFPNAVAIDVQGRIFISDYGNRRVRMVDMSTGIINTVAGTGQQNSTGDQGPATSASVKTPSGVLVHPDEFLYIADSGSANVRAVAIATSSTPPANTISGTIRYYSTSTPVSNVTVVLSSTNGAQFTTTTDSSGRYSFDNPGTGVWKLTPSRTGGLAKISIIDAVQILESTVRSRTFNEEQLLAADVSGDDGKAAVLDAVNLLNYTVRKITRFPAAIACNSDWIFAPTTSTSAQDDPAPSASGGCRMGSITYTNPSGTIANQDFSAILIGDPSGNWPL